MNETLQTIAQLRSIHGNFSSQDIPEDALQTILDASVRAANASARQGYSIIVVDDRELMKKLCGYAGSRGLVFCADYTRILDTAAYLGHPFVASGITPFVTSAMDALLAAQTAAIAAKSLGIDSLFTNGIHRGDMSRVYKLLELPEKYCFPVIMLVLGYPDAEPAFQKGRLHGPGVIHRGTYHRATQDELQAMVAQYDDPDVHMGLNETWRKDGFAHYLDWFYTVWSSPARWEKSSGKSQVWETLERCGFLE